MKFDLAKRRALRDLSSMLVFSHVKRSTVFIRRDFQ